jgi:hypothetical protein
VFCKQSSVINLIYSKQLILLYNFLSGSYQSFLRVGVVWWIWGVVLEGVGVSLHDELLRVRVQNLSQSHLWEKKNFTTAVENAQSAVISSEKKYILKGEACPFPGKWEHFVNI